MAKRKKETFYSVLTLKGVDGEKGKYRGLADYTFFAFNATEREQLTPAGVMHKVEVGDYICAPDDFPVHNTFPELLIALEHQFKTFTSYLVVGRKE